MPRLPSSDSMRRRLLADDVGARTPVQDDVDAEVGAEDVPADQVGGVRLVQRRGDPLLGVGHLAPDVQEHLRRADRVGRDQAALDELVGIALHEHAVLVGAGLGLVAVDDDVARPHPGRAEAPLGARGEAGAAAPEQRRVLDRRTDLGGRHARARRGSPGSRGRTRSSGSRPSCGASITSNRDDTTRGHVARRWRGGRGVGHDGSLPVPRRRPRPRARAIHTGLDLLLGRRDVGDPVGAEVLADLAERAVRRDTSSRAPAAEVGDQLGRSPRGTAVEVAVVHLERRRLGARRDALDVLEREQAVGGGAAGADAERLLGVLQQLLAAEQLARDVGAHVDAVLARPRAS